MRIEILDEAEKDLVGEWGRMGTLVKN